MRRRIVRASAAGATPGVRFRPCGASRCAASCSCLTGGCHHCMSNRPSFFFFWACALPAKAHTSAAIHAIPRPPRSVTGAAYIWGAAPACRRACRPGVFWERMGDDAAELARLLDARNEHPESLAEIDAEIWQRFGRTRAVLVLDMCGFSRLTMRYGITHFLAMIRRLQTIVRPVIVAGGGHVVKTEADNVFATFDDVPEALATARAIQRALDTANTFLPEDWDLHAAIGIGYGPLIL